MIDYDTQIDVRGTQLEFALVLLLESTICDFFCG